MSDQKTLQVLKDRLDKEEAAYRNHQQEQEQFLRLPRKRYFAANRKESDIIRRIATLKTAIELFEKPFSQVNIYEGCLMGLTNRREDKENILDMADSYTLNKRAEAAKILFKTSLPIAKRQVLARLDNWSKNI